MVHRVHSIWQLRQTQETHGHSVHSTSGSDRVVPKGGDTLRGVGARRVGTSPAGRVGLILRENHYLI